MKWTHFFEVAMKCEQIERYLRDAARSTPVFRPVLAWEVIAEGRNMKVKAALPELSISFRTASSRELFKEAVRSAVTELIGPGTRVTVDFC